MWIMASGWLKTEVLPRKSETSSSEVSYLFDVGRPLLSASAPSRPQDTNTFPLIPAADDLTDPHSAAALIPLHFQWCDCTWMCVHVSM